MTTFWTCKLFRVTNPKRLMCLNACYMFFPAMLAGPIKYISCFTFRAEREQEPVTVIRSALH